MKPFSFVSILMTLTGKDCVHIFTSAGGVYDERNFIEQRPHKHYLC